MNEDKVGVSELVKKIIAMIREVGVVPKSGVNEFYHYNYRRHEDIMNKLQPALLNQGLVIVPASKKILFSEPGYVLIEVIYEITDGQTTLTFVGLGEGADKSKDGKPGDKAVYKAQTGAMKYALNDMLMLAGEDPEADTKTHNDEKPQPAKTEQKPTISKDARKFVVLGPIPTDYKTNKANYNAKGQFAWKVGQETNGKDIWKMVHFIKDGEVEQKKSTIETPDPILMNILTDRMDEMISNNYDQWTQDKKNNKMAKLRSLGINSVADEINTEYELFMQTVNKQTPEGDLPF